MPIRNFDGVDDRIGFGAIGLDIANGPFTILGVVRPTTLNTTEAFISLRSAGTTVASLADGGSGKLALYTDTLDVSSIVNLTAGDHQIIAVTKANGVVPVRFHRKQLGTGSWSHSDSGSTHPNVAGVVEEVAIGGLNPANTGAVKDFDGSVFAIWYGVALTDSDLESVQAVATSQFLYELGAVALWNLNQSNTATAVVDQIGDADQTVITGTSVVSGSDPSWDFTISVPPPLQFSVRLSGGASNSDPATSIGGTLSSVDMPVGIFDNVTNSQRAAGLIDYRLVYIHNDDADDALAVVYLPTPLESGREMAVGVATQAAGVTVTAVANDTTAPVGVTFLTPTTTGAAVALGTIPSGSFRGVWLRRTVTSGTPADPTNFGKLRFELSRLT